MWSTITNSSAISIPPNDEGVTANKLSAMGGDITISDRRKELSLDMRAVNKHASCLFYVLDIENVGQLVSLRTLRMFGR